MGLNVQEILFAREVWEMDDADEVAEAISALAESGSPDAVWKAGILSHRLSELRNAPADAPQPGE